MTRFVESRHVTGDANLFIESGAGNRGRRLGTKGRSEGLGKPTTRVVPCSRDKSLKISKKNRGRWGRQKSQQKRGRWTPWAL